MGLSNCGKFLKYSMFIFNAIILIAGCAILGFGAYSKTTDTNMKHLTSIMGSYYYETLLLVLIITGGVVIILAFLGCCGAIKEVKCMLGTFFVLLFIMFLGMLVGGVVVYIYRASIGDAIMDSLYKSLNSSYGSTDKKEITESWNKMQTVFRCCGVVGGVNSNTSWAYYKHNTAWFRNQTGETIKYIPRSCCSYANGSNLTKCTEGTVGMKSLMPKLGPPVTSDFENDLVFTDGCYTAIIDFLYQNARILGGVSAAVGGLMILGMVFSICLCRRIRDEFMFD